MSNTLMRSAISSRQLEQLSQAMLNFKNISDLVAWLDRIRD